MRQISVWGADRNQNAFNPSLSSKRARLLGVLSVLLTLLGLGSMAHAQIIQPFALRYQTNAKGDIVLIGNTLSTCCDPSSLASINNNNQTSLVDVDTDSNTTNSSEANLNLTGTPTVVFAALYWGSRTNAALGSSTIIKLKAPNASGYTNLTSDSLYKTVYTVSAGVTTNPYHAFKDVTNEVIAGGNGTYRVGGIAIDTANDGLGGYGGWSLVVVYKDPALTLRNLSVFDGFAVVSQSAGGQSITINGFLSPRRARSMPRLALSPTRGIRH